MCLGAACVKALRSPGATGVRGRCQGSEVAHNCRCDHSGSESGGAGNGAQWSFHSSSGAPWDPTAAWATGRVHRRRGMKPGPRPDQGGETAADSNARPAERCSCFPARLLSRRDRSVAPPPTRPLLAVAQLLRSWVG